MSNEIAQGRNQQSWARQSSIGKKGTSKAILHKLVNGIPELIIVINLVVNLTRNSGISSDGANFPMAKINGDFNPKVIPQKSPKVESMRVSHNPQRRRQTHHEQASTHMRRTAKMSSPSSHQHLSHFNNTLMVPLSDPFNPTLELIHELHNRRNHQLRTIVPIPSPRTFHS
ncbi:hypothetical protein CR513_62770, partial [Mucuna pruriens]